MTAKKTPKGNKDAEWKEAKHLCRLNDETVRMAKELGMSPRSLMKNIPSQTQQWKAPVAIWIQDLHEKRFSKREDKSVSRTSESAEDISVAPKAEPNQT